MIKINGNSKIFYEEPFIKDEVLFNLISFIREVEDSIIVKSDSGKAIIAQSSAKYPAWVWTEENMESEDYRVLAEEFYSLFSNFSKLSFVAKPKVSKFLAEDYARRRNIEWKTTMRMEAYHCPEVISQANIPGQVCRPSLEAVNTIAGFIKGFMLDCFGTTISEERQMKLARTFAASDNFYLWRVNNEIVGMANAAHSSERHVRINEVYTSPKHRNKGYAAALISEICKIALSKSKIPMLYTDLSNPASNKAYKKAGFIECGEVNEVQFLF